MKLKCLIFGHQFKPIGEGTSFDRNKTIGQHEHDGVRLYKCSICSKLIKQEENYF
ncbi:hypothetical protein [Candidatus Hodarchaeum mangrovi]